MEHDQDVRQDSGLYEGISPLDSVPAVAATGGKDEATQPPPALQGTPFYKKRWFLISQVLTALVSLALLFVILYPVVRAIAQHVINVSVINIDTVAINTPGNTSFDLAINGYVTHTGIFSASIEFPEPVDVYWAPKNGSQLVKIGTTGFDPLTAKNRRAYINQTHPFTVSDQSAFGDFTKEMITSDTFTWVLKTGTLSVRALRLPRSTGLNFNKNVTLPGINNFIGNITLDDFQMPRDAPNGAGIEFSAVTTLTNPSPFQLSLGTIVFNLTYNGVYLGQGTQENTQIKPGNNTVTLSGVLVPHNGSASDLQTVSQLFTNYLNSDLSNVLATGVSTLQPDGSEISWLSQGLQALTLQVPFVPKTPINPIQAISIGDFDLNFTAPTAWAPVSNSKTVRATMQLPFGFNVEIGEIQNAFNISKNGSTVGSLSTPLGASTSSITVFGATNTSGTIDIQVVDTPIDVPTDNHPVFSTFNFDLTNNAREDFLLVGESQAVANLSIGQVTLDAIKFNVSSGLFGLQGLKNRVQITGVDVTGGTTDGIQLAINTTIQNPSNLNLNTGDLSIVGLMHRAVVQLFRGSDLLGTVLMPNLTLLMGNNSVAATSSFAASANSGAQQTLNDFVGGTDVGVHIGGYGQSTQVASLLEAFESLQLDVNLPALQSKLLSSAALEVLNTTGHENNITHVTVDLANPFTAGLRISQVTSTVSFDGIRLGTINTGTNFSSAGHGTTTSPNLDLDLNMDPQSLFTVTRALAVNAGLGTEQLDTIVQLGGYHYLSTNSRKREAVEAEIATRPLRRNNIFTGFNLPSFVDTAFKKLVSDVQLQSTVTIGHYETTLTYNQSGVPTKTDQSLNLILPILAQPIVQTIVSGSALGVDSVLITNPAAQSFGTTLAGSITNAGPFDAVISFPAGLTISWNGQALGTIKMPDVNVTGDVGAQFQVQTDFSIADVSHLTDFTRTLLTTESFEWQISGENLSVSAIGISVPGISLPSKTVTLKGMNSLANGVRINSFDLPANDPAGGIHLTLDTSITNPSQVGVQLSSIGFENFFGSTNIGPAQSNGSFTLAPQSTVGLGLVGRLIPQTEQSGLDAVSQIFNRFIHGMDSEVSVHGASAGPSGAVWLNDAITSLIVTTTLPNQGKLDIIKSISLNELDLRFSTDTAFGPPTSTNDASAAFTIPFAFPIDVVALSQNITVGAGGTNFAQLVVPKGPSQTDVSTRIIHLTFADVPFAVFGDQHGAFEQFLAATATSATETMSLSGAADTDAQTAVGLLSLTDIEFSVSTSIAGLQGLKTKPVQLVSELDVNHGFPNYLLIKVNASIFNPSNITLGAGDVAFGLVFNGATIGSSDIANIVIVPGNGTYPIDVHYAPQGSAVPTGQLLLENYLQGVDSATTIQGSTDSTPIQSLQLALSEISLSPVTIPAIHQNLIPSAALTFPTDIVQTGIASTSFTLVNPFTASINLLKLAANVTHANLNIGAINHVDVSSSPIHANGHSTITSPQIPFQFNLDPLTIIGLVVDGAQANGVDLGPLVQLFGIVVNNPNFHPPINTSVATTNSTCSSGTQFDVNGAILSSLQNLAVTLDIQTSTKLDDFATDLAFKQFNVSAKVDRTALYLIGAVAPPIVQTLVTGSNLTFSAANITNLSDGGFDLSLEGALTNIGPLDASISFPEPVTVTWQGSNIAQIALPDLCAAANTGIPNLKTNAHLTITDEAAFTAFATFLLHNPEFTWTISTNALRVTALGTIFNGVSLNKDISFKAFNNLPGVTISNFNLPSDDPAGGIHIETDSAIPSPSQLGIDLGTVGFEAFFNGVDLGPLSGSNLFLAPMATTTEHLSGRLVPQNDQTALDTIGVLFSNFLAGQNQTLNVKGSFVQPSGSSSSVSWLSAAFQTLELNVILPGQIFQIIQSITLDDLEIVMTQASHAFAPPASSQRTVAEFKNPFGFSLQVVQSAQNIIIAGQGVDIAQLVVPTSNTVSGVSTGNIAELDISFSNQTLQSLNNAAFAQFFAAVTDTASVTFELKGSANITGKTTVGNIPISGIPFNVTTSLAGLNGFGGTAGLSNVTVVGSGGAGGNQYILATLTTTLSNPSNISLQTVGIEFPVIYQGTNIGRAAIPTLNLVPGQNVIASEFHYMPANANDTVAQGFLTSFLQTNNALPLTVGKGDSQSSPFASLVLGLEGVQLSTSLQALNSPPIITHVNVQIPLSALVDNLVDVNFDIANSLDTPITIEFVQSSSGVSGTTYALFDQPFTSFTIPAHGTANSGTFGNVLLTQGAIASLGIIPLGMLDVFSAVTTQVGKGGYVAPWLHINQLGVPTAYQLNLFGLNTPLSSGSTSANSTAALSSFLSAATSMAQSASAAASNTSGGGASATSAVSNAASSASAHVMSSLAAKASSAAVNTPSAVTQGSSLSEEVVAY
ncbi:hypothetical protein K488DRAFT_76325 [Vararia minispora EC-137]|uniref:Uncharacterized protein n=1 Tax=Vararia minispora EC-137 TaxID=1314806 RepID=A0ACB8QVI2_9AGAM|nr:hypothetical protein K488DRAFT_76325 [Vararia minispora EC-137]